MRQLLVNHLEWMRVRQCAPDTVYGRQAALRMFLDWFEDRGITQCEDVTRAMMERYQRWLFHFRKENGKPLSVGTQYMRLMAAQQFLKWAVRQGIIPLNPAADLDLPKLGVRLPKDVMTPSEAERVLAMPDVDTVLGLRDRLIMELMYATGIRRKELANLTVHDVDAERETLMVRAGKGNRDRVVPTGERALNWLMLYLAEGRPKLVAGVDSGNLVLNEHGKKIRADTLTGIIRRYVESAGVKKQGSCHLFRHTMATAMLEGGADIRFIQVMLGHAHLHTTEIYTRVSIGKLREVHRATHPGARMKAKPEETAAQNIRAHDVD